MRYHLGLAWSLEEAATARLKSFESVADGSSPLTADERQRCEAALALLGNTDWVQREQASKTLATLMPRDAAVLLAVQSQDPEVTARIDSILCGSWRTQAVEHYRQAYEQSVARDLHADFFDAEADNTISVKAGERLLALLPMQPGVVPDEIEKIKRSLQVIKAKSTVGHAY